MSCKRNIAVLCLICLLTISVAAAASFSLFAFPNAKIVFDGFRMVGNGSTVQGYVDISVKNIETTGVIFFIEYDTDYILLSDSADNEPVEINGSSQYTTDHNFFVQNTDAFREGCFLDAPIVNSPMSKAYIDKGYLMMNFTPTEDSENDSITESDDGRLLISANSSEGVKIGSISFMIKNPGAFAALTQDELNNIIKIASPSTVDSSVNVVSDTGVYISYIDDDGNLAFYDDVTQYIEAEWNIKAEVSDVAPQIYEKTVTSYEIYGDGTDNDLFDYLNRYMSMIILTYADGKQSSAKFVWDSQKASVSGVWDAKGGKSYTVTQPYNDKFDIEVTVNVEAVTLEDVYADNDNITYCSSDESFPQTIEDLNLPSKAHAVLSPYVTGMGIDDMTIGWYRLEGESSAVSALPDGFANGGTFTFIGTIGENKTSLEQKYPWLTAKDINEITVVRNVVSDSAQLAKNLNVISSWVDDGGVWTVTVEHEDGSNFDGGDGFSIRLPDGAILDISDADIKYTIDSSSSSQRVITVSANYAGSDYARSTAQLLNLGKRAGSFYIAETKAYIKGEYADCTPEARRNIYTSSLTLDYSGSTAQVFAPGANETLPKTITLPLSSDTVGTTYNGYDGSEPGELNTIAVNEWIITETDGIKTAVGTLAETTYTNYGTVSNPNSYTVTIIYKTSADKTEAGAIEDIPDFVFDPKQVGYDYSQIQTQEFTIHNIGTESLSGLNIDISGEGFILRKDVSTELGAGESAAFSISTQKGLPIGEHTAVVTIRSNNGADALADGVLDTFTISFTVTEEAVYRVTIKVIGEGSAETVSKIYTFTAETEVEIQAKPDDDCEFVEWTSDSGVEFADSTAESTSFAMPAYDVTITAEFKTTLAARLKLSELHLKNAESGAEYTLYNSEWTAVEYAPSTREYYAAVPSTAENGVLWFKPQEFVNDDGTFKGTITVTNTHGAAKDTITSEFSDLYYKTEGIALEISPAENKIEITMTYDDPDDDPDAGEASKTYTIHVYRKLSKSELAEFEYGNSPYGLIMRDNSITDKDALKTEFVTVNGYKFTDTVPEGGEAGIWYNPDAWTGTNYDLDKEALFVYTDAEFTDTGYKSLKNSIGETVDDAVVTKTVKVKLLSEDSTLEDSFTNVTEAELALPQSGAVSELKKRIRPDVYSISYTFKDFDGTDMSVTKPLVVLSKPGDVNVSQTTDETDSRLIVNRFKEALPYNIADYGGAKLYKYRICDASSDGNVNALDANAVRKGVTPGYSNN